MTIVLCGGGSGGHITPLLAVASELRRRHPRGLRLVYLGERNGKFAHITQQSKLFDELHFISAGKLRRYHGESALTRLFDIKTNLLNIRDVFRLLVGVFESFLLIKRLKPDSILLKGGFVCVPAAVAARLNHVPYITHDSDALPGLSNRLAARWARYHATALPARYYPYPQSSVKMVGVPTDERFRPYSESEQAILREKYNIKPDDPLLLITGGSNGARRLNKAVIDIMPKLFAAYPNLYIFHQIGAGNDDQTAHLSENFKRRIKFFDFSNELFHLSAIADLIVTRAGASAVADLASQHKACILVPNPYLTGGHQLKNADVYEEAKAAFIVQEKDMVDNPEVLLVAILSLIGDEQRREALASNLKALMPAQSPAKALSELLEEIAAK